MTVTQPAPKLPVLLGSAARLEGSALCQQVSCSRLSAQNFGRVQAEDFLTKGGLLNISRLKGTGQIGFAQLSTITFSSERMEPLPIDEPTQRAIELVVWSFTGQPWTVERGRACQAEGANITYEGVTPGGIPYTLNCLNVMTSQLISIRHQQIDTSY